jgi:hypothetical protein
VSKINQVDEDLRHVAAALRNQGWGEAETVKALVRVRESHLDDLYSAIANVWNPPKSSPTTLTGGSDA